MDDLWSGKRDSNPRPSAWEADALPTELLPHFLCKNIDFLVFDYIMLRKNTNWV